MKTLIIFIALAWTAQAYSHSDCVTKDQFYRETAKQRKANRMVQEYIIEDMNFTKAQIKVNKDFDDFMKAQVKANTAIKQFVTQSAPSQ